ncbi:HP0268 family nuclease [Sulfurimonas sp.]|uniref:HP0268 family nuclease n=1 Tax=Sulfurimonas sp. TaxID=2022749 RepID=UPI0035697124
MDLKFARTELDAKPKKADVKKIEESVEKHGSVIFYFDRENSHKDLLELQDYFEEKGKSFYMNEVKFGLSDNEYMYQVHIID